MNRGAPTVSIVIPVFNRADLIVRAVRSCLGQTCEVEIIVMDDGSAEDIRTTLEKQFAVRMKPDECPDRSSFIRYFRQPNQGACVARNEGLARVSGEFIKFLDSDDELLPNSLAAEVKMARQTQCDALLTSWEERTYREDGTEDLAKRRSQPAPDLSHGIDDMLTGKSVCASAALYRTDFVRSLRWDPAWTKAQDWGWALTVCLAGARFSSLDIPSCAYNHHAGARITNYGDLMMRSTRARQMLLQMVERELRAQTALTDDRKRKLAQYYYRDCQVLAQHDPGEWRRVWMHCEELCPGFHPVDPNRIIRVLTRVLGIRRGIMFYVRFKRAAQRLGLLRA
jgi:glycosyltransferase involved in cell wall biosynthesis